MALTSREHIGCLVTDPPRVEKINSQSIIIRFFCYSIEEKILHKAWGKFVFLTVRRAYFNYDFPLAVLQKLREYSEAKTVLRERNVSIQTPFTKNGMSLYQTLEEVTMNMKD